MKKLLLILLFLFVNSQAHQGIFQSVPEKDAVLLQTGKDKRGCPVCGMHIPMFYKTSYAIRFKDGKYRQYCSLNCLVEDIELGDTKNKKDQIAKILVVDTKNIILVDAKKAHYVVGSKKPGTMSMTSKYAFEHKEDAIEFQKENGGNILDFESAYNNTLKEFQK